MSGITYLAKFEDGTIWERYSARHLVPQYPFAWRTLWTTTVLKQPPHSGRAVGDTWNGQQGGYSSRRDLASKASNDLKFDTRGFFETTNVKREVVETRHVFGRLTKREKATLEAVFDAAKELA